MSEKTENITTEQQNEDAVLGVKTKIVLLCTVFFHSCAPLFSFAVLMVLLYTYKHTMSIGNVCFFQIFSFFYFQLSEHIKKGSRTHLAFLICSAALCHRVAVRSRNLPCLNSVPEDPPV